MRARVGQVYQRMHTLVRVREFLCVFTAEKQTYFRGTYKRHIDPKRADRRIVVSVTPRKSGL